MKAVPPLEEVARVLADAAGISLDGALERTLREAVDAAARSLALAPGELARRVAGRDPRAVDALVEHAVVGETLFWRHAEQLAAIGRIAASRPRPLRIWSAGCASGEEPYSVAIALLEAGRAGAGDRVLATDVSERAISAARDAVYGRRTRRRLPRDIADRWFEGSGEPRRIAAAARALVTFARHNLAADPPPASGPFDVVLCRNVLIYFTPERAAAVARAVAGALAPGGVLALGPVELPLAASLGLEWIEEDGATLLRRPR